MKLGVLSFVAALLAAPLAAQAADTPARFAGSLRATVVDRFTYELSQRDGECTVRRSGSGGRELKLRSVRAARIVVSGGAAGVVYRPSRLAVRLTGRSIAGSFDELRVCRAEPIERTKEDCRVVSLSARVLRPRFHRPSRNRIAFRSTPRPGDPIGVCGLGRRSPVSAWLDLAKGSLDEDALLSGRSRRVIVRGRTTRQGTVLEESGLTVKQRATVSWTLTFRRLG
jgi:hypothetical protein